MNLIGKLRREKEIRQQCCRNSTKMRREKKKRGREKAEEFQQHCYRNSSAQIAACSVKKKSNCGNAIAEKGKKKCFGNCGNAIAGNGKKKIYEICE